MSLDIGSLVGYIKLDHTGVGQGVIAAQRDMRTGMDKLARDAGQQGTKAGKAAGEGMASGLKGQLGNLAKIVAGAFAVERVVTGLRTAKDAASDLNETTSMSAVIFGKNADAMKAFAATGPRALGLSTEATLRYSASLGDMLLQLGFAENATVSLSQSTVQMAADLGSFKNLKTEDVLDRISASLRGEYDSLQALIPNINAARVEQEALAATGKASASALTAQEKATATLAIIQKDGARASGDFARTRDGEANASKTAAAEAQNLAAQFGQKLLPAYTALVVFGRDEALPFLGNVIDYMGAAGDAAEPLTDALGGVVSGFRGMPEPIQAATLGLLAFVALRGRVEDMGATLGGKVREGATGAGKALDGLRLGIMYAGESSETAAGRFGAVTKSIGASAASGLRGAAKGLLGVLGGPWGLAFAGAVAIVGTYIAKQKEAKARVQALTETLDANTGAITKNTREKVRSSLVDSDASKNAQKLGIALQDVFDAAMGSAPAMERVNAAVAKLNPTTDGYVKTVTRGAQANSALKSEIGSVLGFIQQQTTDLDSASNAAKRKGDITLGAADAETEYGDAAEGVTGKVKDQAQAVRDAAQAVLDGLTAKGDAFDAEVDYQAALDDTAAAIKENGKTATKGGDGLKINTDAQRENAKALKAQADAAITVAEKNRDAGAGLDLLRANMDTARDAFIDNAVKMGINADVAAGMADEFGLTKGTVDKLATAVEGLPSSKAIAIEVKAKAAATRLQNLKDLLAGLNSKTVVVDVVTGIRYTSSGTRKGGGRSTAGGQTIDSAEGNILRFADGTEDHRAFIAGRGTPQRVFNEPETGGEAYTPLANDARRPRAVGITRQVAGMFGYDLVPKGEGGGAPVMADKSTHYLTPVSIGVAHFDSGEDLLEKARAESRDRAIGGGL